MAEEAVVAEEKKTEGGIGEDSLLKAAHLGTLTKADNPLDAPSRNQMFKAEPFFKEEATTELNEVGTPKTPQGEKKPEDKLELNPDGTQKTPVVEKQPESTTTEETVEQIPEAQFVELLNQSLNDPEVSFGTIADIKSVIEENKKFKAAQDQLNELTQEERARIEVGRQFGDFGLFDRITSIDPAKITPKEALKQVYFIENRGKDPLYLEKTFEKEFSKVYAEDEDDPDYATLKLKSEGQDAINTIVEWQKDLKAKGKTSLQAEQENAKKDREAEDQKWFAAVDNVLSKSDRISFKAEDGTVINVVMDAKDKKDIQAAMDSPIPYLKSLIVDEKGNYDYSKLFEFVMITKYQNQIRNEAYKVGQATKHEALLKTNREPTKASAAGNVNSPLNLAEAFAKHMTS